MFIRLSYIIEEINTHRKMTICEELLESICLMKAAGRFSYYIGPCIVSFIFKF